MNALSTPIAPAVQSLETHSKVCNKSKSCSHFTLPQQSWNSIEKATEREKEAEIKAETQSIGETSGKILTRLRKMKDKWQGYGLKRPFIKMCVW